MRHGERRRDRRDVRVVGYSIDKRNSCLRILFEDNKFLLDKRFKYDRGLLIFGKAEFDLDSSIVYYLDNYRVCNLEKFIHVCDTMYKNPKLLDDVLNLADIYCNDKISFDLLSGKFVFTDDGDSIVIMEVKDDCLVMHTPSTGAVDVPIDAIDNIVQSLGVREVIPFSRPFYINDLEIDNLSEEVYEDLISLFL